MKPAVKTPSSDELCRQLVRLGMGAEDRAEITGVLEASSGAVWESGLKTLLYHGLLPLIAYRLRECGLESLAPAPLSGRLRKHYRDTLLRNQRYVSCLGRVLELLRARDIEPMLWKGFVVMDRAWPDMGARILGDLDLFIEPEEMAPAAEALIGAGFWEAPKFRESSGTYIDSEGISVDLQYKRMGHGRWASDPSLLKSATRLFTPDSIPHLTLTSLEPTAILAGLACHLARHDSGGSSQGTPLRWLLDLHFLLRRWGAEIETNHLVFLANTDAGLSLLLRSVHFFCGEMGMRYEGCNSLIELARGLEPYTFGEILRSRRLGVWHLPTAETGWLYLFAHCLRMRTVPGLAAPRPSDFAGILPDLIRKQRMARRAARLRATLG